MCNIVQGDKKAHKLRLEKNLIQNKNGQTIKNWNLWMCVYKNV